MLRTAYGFREIVSRSCKLFHVEDDGLNLTAWVNVSCTACTSIFKCRTNFSLYCVDAAQSRTFQGFAASHAWSCGAILQIRIRIRIRIRILKISVLTECQGFLLLGVMDFCCIMLDCFPSSTHLDLGSLFANNPHTNRLFPVVIAPQIFRMRMHTHVTIRTMQGVVVVRTRPAFPFVL